MKPVWKKNFESLRKGSGGASVFERQIQTLFVGYVEYVPFKL